MYIAARGWRRPMQSALRADANPHAGPQAAPRGASRFLLGRRPGLDLDRRRLHRGGSRLAAVARLALGSRALRLARRRCGAPRLSGALDRPLEWRFARRVRSLPVNEVSVAVLYAGDPCRWFAPTCPCLS